MIRWCFALLLATVTAAEFDGPRNIDELIAMAFPTGPAPRFVPLKQSPNIAVASNDSAILKIGDLRISPYPLVPGHITFNLWHELTDVFPKSSNLHLVTWIGRTPSYSGPVDICEYMKFLRLDCPLEKYNEQHQLQKVLLVPESAKHGRFSFIANVTTPDQELLVLMAGIVDLANGVFHNEL